MAADTNHLLPGERIRLFRKRMGLTQVQCAQLKGCTASAWRKWESGERKVVTVTDWIEIARILRVRDLYKLTGLPAGEQPEEPAEHETVPGIRAAMVSFGPRLADAPDVERLDHGVQAAWDVWQDRGPFIQIGTTLPGMITEVRATIPRVYGAELDHLLRTAAMLYFLTTEFTMRVGAHDVSLAAADRAMAAAIKANDLDYRAAAALYAGMALAEQGHTDVVLTLARDATAELAPTLSDEQPRRASVLGDLHLLRALQYARLGNGHRALAALDTADAIAAKVGDRNDFRTAFGPTSVGIHRMCVAVELSKPRDAIRLAQLYDASTVRSVERRLSYYVTLAKAYSLRGEGVAAVHMLLRAEQESADEVRNNVNIHAMVRELLCHDSTLTRTELEPLADRIGIFSCPSRDVPRRGSARTPSRVNYRPVTDLTNHVGPLTNSATARGTGGNDAVGSAGC